MPLSKITEEEDQASDADVFSESNPRKVYRDRHGNLWESCTRTEACGDKEEGIQPREFQVNWNHPDTIDNWITQMGLICENKYKISFIGSAYFIGVIASMATLGALPDAYGRRPFVLLHALCIAMAYVGIVCLSFSLSFLYWFFGLLGFAGGLGIVVGYNYTMEIMPDSHKAFATTFLMGGSSVLGISYTLCLQYLTKNWVWVQLVGVGASVLAVLMLFTIPESPKFYFMKR